MVLIFALTIVLYLNLFNLWSFPKCSNSQYFFRNLLYMYTVTSSFRELRADPNTKPDPNPNAYRNPNPNANLNPNANSNPNLNAKSDPNANP